MELAIIFAVAGATVFLGNYLSRVAADWHRQRIGGQELARLHDQPDSHQRHD